MHGPMLLSHGLIIAMAKLSRGGEGSFFLILEFSVVGSFNFSTPPLWLATTQQSALVQCVCSDSPMAELEGHYERVSRLAYHPSGRFLATAW